jgi:VWFA-related protein
MSVLVVAVLLLASNTPFHGQQAVFSARSDLVVLHVTVTDRRGGYVTGLPRDAFRVFEEDQPQAISFLTDADTPVTVGLLIDSSGSMLANRELVIAAAAAFAEASHPQDEIFALAFNERVRAALPEEEPFTSDVGTLRSALDRTIRARGRTALYDAVLAGLDYLGRGSRSRRVLVVVSDGSDNASRAAAEEVFQRAQASNAVIYTLALRDPAGVAQENPRLMRELARLTGGETYRPDRPREVETALREIARQIRHTYTIGFVPSHSPGDESFRRLRVEVDTPDRRRVRVRTRGGYVTR